MKCNCMWTEVIFAALVLVFAAWPTLIFSAEISRWIVIISAAVLLIHAVKVHPGHFSSSGTKDRRRPRSRRKRRR